jgi:hypothetical protein
MNWRNEIEWTLFIPLIDLYYEGNVTFHEEFMLLLSKDSVNNARW